MAKEERSISDWERMNKYETLFNSGIVFKHLPLPLPGETVPPPRAPPNPKIIWRGSIVSHFRKYPPPPGYGIADRVNHIVDSILLEYREDEFEWKGDLLEELLAYDAESINVARVLHSMGRLFSFLSHVLSQNHACIRATAAELITTMVQNHPTSQQLLVEEKCLQPLLNNFSSDPDETSRTKALGAISSLIRNNKSGITAFRLEKGYAALKKASDSRNVCQRELLKLTRYLLHEKKKRKEGTNGKKERKKREELKLVLQGLPSAVTPTVQSNSSSNLY